MYRKWLTFKATLMKISNYCSLKVACLGVVLLAGYPGGLAVTASPITTANATTDTDRTSMTTALTRENSLAMVTNQAEPNPAVNAWLPGNYVAGSSLFAIPSQELVVARLNQRVVIKVALKQLNNLNLPFDGVIVDTVAAVAAHTRGSSIMVAPHTSDPIVMIVRDQQQPQLTLTLELQPTAKLEAINKSIIIPELQATNFLLNQPNLDNQQYLGALSRLLRFASEAIVNNKVKLSKEPYYNFNNFVFTGQNVNPFDLGLVELSLEGNSPHKLHHLLASSCRYAELEVNHERFFQPTNIYFAGLGIRLVAVSNNSTSDVEFDFKECLQTNLVAATFIDQEDNVIAPGQATRILVVEKLSY